MKKTVKILSILMIAMVLITFSTSVLAAKIDPANVQPTYDGDATVLTERVGKIMGMIRNISVIAAVVIIMILGIKYMMGSVEEKAGYQKSFVPLIVGIICVVAATSIASFIFNMVE